MDHQQAMQFPQTDERALSVSPKAIHVQRTMVPYLVGVGGLGLVGVGLLLLELLLELLLPLPLHLLLPSSAAVRRPQIKPKHRQSRSISTQPWAQRDHPTGEMVNGQRGGWVATVTDLDVDALLGALLLAEHAALAVAEEAPGAGRRRRRGGAEARGEGGQRGPHRHLVLSLAAAMESACGGVGALGPWSGRVRGLASTRMV
jgi:hypothetical protein